MAEKKRDEQPEQPTRDSREQGESGGAAPAKPKHVPAPSSTKPLPKWRVILHNDDENYMDDVVEAITTLTPLKQAEAVLKTKLAHQSGSALLLTTHRERAELYVQQFASKQLTTTAEPDA